MLAGVKAENAAKAARAKTPLSQPDKGLGRAPRARKYVLNDWLNRKPNRPDFPASRDCA